jgi:U4/U6.U5 tri-snRNP-associated protein 2
VRHRHVVHELIKPGIIFTTFQGVVRMETQKIVVRADAGENEKPQFDVSRGKRSEKPFDG